MSWYRSLSKALTKVLTVGEVGTACVTTDQCLAGTVTVCPRVALAVIKRLQKAIPAAVTSRVCIGVKLLMRWTRRNGHPFCVFGNPTIVGFGQIGEVGPIMKMLRPIYQLRKIRFERNARAW